MKIDATMIAICTAIEDADTFTAIKALGTVLAGLLIREAIDRKGRTDPKHDALQGLQAVHYALKLMIENADYGEKQQ